MFGRVEGSMDARIVVVALHVCSRFASEYSFNNVPETDDLIGIRAVDLDTGKVKDITIESALKNITALNIMGNLRVYTVLFRGIPLGTLRQVYTYDKKADAYIRLWPDGIMENVGSGNKEMAGIAVKVANIRKGDNYNYARQLWASDIDLSRKRDNNASDCRYIGICLRGEESSGCFWPKAGRLLEMATGKVWTLSDMIKSRMISSQLCIHDWEKCGADEMHTSNDDRLFPVNAMTCYTKGGGVKGRYIILSRKTTTIQKDINKIEYYVGVKAKDTEAYAGVKVMALSEICWLIENTDAEFNSLTYKTYRKYDGSLSIQTAVSVERFPKELVHPERGNTEYVEKTTAGGHSVGLSAENKVTGISRKGSDTLEIPAGAVMDAGSIKWQKHKGIKKLVINKGCSFKKGVYFPRSLKELELHGADAYESIAKLRGSDVLCDTITVGSDITGEQLAGILNKFRSVAVKEREPLSSEAVQYILSSDKGILKWLDEDKLLDGVSTEEYGEYLDDSPQDIDTSMDIAYSLTELSCGTEEAEGEEQGAVVFTGDAELLISQNKKDIDRLNGIGSDVKDALSEKLKQYRGLSRYLNSRYSTRMIQILDRADDKEYGRCLVSDDDNEGNLSETGMIYHKYYTDMQALYVYKYVSNERVTDKNRDSKFKRKQKEAVIFYTEIDKALLKEAWAEHRMNG